MRLPSAVWQTASSVWRLAPELTTRTYGEKKWWVVIVKDQ